MVLVVTKILSFEKKRQMRAAERGSRIAFPQKQVCAETGFGGGQGSLEDWSICILQPGPLADEGIDEFHP